MIDYGFHREPTETEIFYQEMRDFLRTEAQRYRNIMTSNQDVLDAIAAIPVNRLGASLTQLDATVKTAVSDMGASGESARVGFVKALTDVALKLGDVVDHISTIETELTAAIAAQTPPAATVPAPPQL